MMEFQNPDNAVHRATIESLGKRIDVRHADQLIASSADAIVLKEQSARGAYPGVIYLPRANVSATLTPVDAKSTHCPLKSDASYLAHAGEEVAWIYDRPLKGAEILADYVSFYDDRVVLNEH